MATIHRMVSEAGPGLLGLLELLADREKAKEALVGLMKEREEAAAMVADAEGKIGEAARLGTALAGRDEAVKKAEREAAEKLAAAIARGADLDEREKNLKLAHELREKGLDGREAAAAFTQREWERQREAMKQANATTAAELLRREEAVAAREKVIGKARQELEADRKYLDIRITALDSALAAARLKGLAA